MVSAAELQALHQKHQQQSQGQDGSSSQSAAPVRDPFPAIGGGVKDPFPSMQANDVASRVRNGQATDANGSTSSTRQPDL